MVGLSHLRHYRLDWKKGRPFQTDRKSVDYKSSEVGRSLCRKVVSVTLCVQTNSLLIVNEPPRPTSPYITWRTHKQRYYKDSVLSTVTSEFYNRFTGFGVWDSFLSPFLKESPFNSPFWFWDTVSFWGYSAVWWWCVCRLEGLEWTWKSWKLWRQDGGLWTKS